MGVAGGERQTIVVRRAGKVSGGGARLDAGDPRLRVDANSRHVREVDDDRVVDHAEVREAVATTAHREGQGVVAGKVDDCRDIPRVCRADDGTRAAVDIEIEYAAGFVVVGAFGGDEETTQARAGGIHPIVGDGDGRGRYDRQGGDGHNRLLVVSSIGASEFHLRAGGGGDPATAPVHFPYSAPSGSRNGATEQGDGNGREPGSIWRAVAALARGRWAVPGSARGAGRAERAGDRCAGDGQAATAL